ncbi:hypothetical protein BLNAU_11655 [Blattamonas nauphoetae]|uniref:Uncharacterized protein n=1 Tax=Blattamonas nauphoetae TaxID=2049346 RepID=A0ABQ9XQ91_9EUKA|nr:hypothetical protein BLNAU_11655 [Blattamonas nauphoetae]
MDKELYYDEDRPVAAFPTPVAVIGICDAAEYQQYLTKGTTASRKAGTMHNNEGCLFSASRNLDLNTIPQKGQAHRTLFMSELASD